MGVVYEAWQSSVERAVALKILPAGFAVETKALLRFLREGRAAGKLRHPSIVGVHAMGIESDTPYYAMLTGQSPRRSLRSGQRGFEFTRESMESLEEAHDLGLSVGGDLIAPESLDVAGDVLELLDDRVRCARAGRVVPALRA